ncbi:MAG: bifunctional (p)ppGpp synthetase/guanosine-3',5'-bis(diphosphate) 3'-pyrophosphohydrolase [Bacillota bacterium]
MTVLDLLKSAPSGTSSDLRLIERAYEFAREAHNGQYRDSGEEYIEHPLCVAAILAELELDAASIAAGLLHDVVEDTKVSLDQLEKEFGSEIALLVDGVTKLGRLEYRSQEEVQAENLRKMFLAMAKDIRVIIIKLADRLHNMRTLNHLSSSRQIEIANETLDIYAPLAHRLGMWRFKWEMEDLAFRHKSPQEYAQVVEKVARQQKDREGFIQEVIRDLKERMDDAEIEADIQGRAKHYHSIYRKMLKQQKDISEIYDLMAFRIIVDTVKDCYAVLGLAHSLWKPIPGRFKDYIAMPKSNMYQSLHTTVIGPRGDPFEVQIRTWEMHRTAEYGIAAHWRYKEESPGDREFDKKLSWMRQVLEWQRDMRDAREFMESLRIDLFSDEVFVFTPKGDVMDLPAGATPIDFAYSIHTEVGHRCVGAKVNGRIVPLDYKLQNGEIVEILTSKQSPGPSADWLKVVKTSGAKNRIRQWFKRERRDENIARGRELLEKEVKRQGFDVHDFTADHYMEAAARKLNLQSPEDLLAAIGYGGFTAGAVTSKIREEWKKDHVPVPLLPDDKEAKPAPGAPGEGVRVKGVTNLLVKFARCCNPVPGDPIIGYITRGRGLTIHRMDCPNVTDFVDDQDRLMEVGWDDTAHAVYPVELEVDAADRPGLLSDVAHILSDAGVNVTSAKVMTSKRKKMAIFRLVLEIRDLKQLETLRRQISKIPDVLEVRRVTKEITGRNST